ncbi:MAG TPA: DUF4091 domain-containing protein [Armatimonadetes bacterium]|nr:DUF4091 domain-containing protein [Armatimonadota bacterium]
MYFIFAALALLPTPAEGLTVWVTHGSERVFQHTPPGKQRTARLQAARNEYEPFQIALRAGTETITDVTAEASDLTGPNGAVIRRDHLTLFREHYVYLRRPSYRSEAPPGLYPEALIPFVNPLDGSELTPWDARRNPRGAKYDAVPFAVWRDWTQVLWVDVYVPSDAVPGEYRGTITIRARNQPDLLVPIELTVWDFTLPTMPTVRSHFGSFSRIAPAHGVEPGSPEYRVIERRYCQALADHRITPPIPRHLYPAVKEDGSIDPSATHEELAQYMADLRVNAFPLRWPPFKDPLGADREKAKRYLASFYEYLQENGWAEGAYLYILDEPNDAEAYEQVRRRAALVHEAHPQIRVLCTEQTKPSNPAWGDLNEAVDIWVPLWPLHDEETAAQRLAAGDELWSYTALCQGPQPSPWWQIDFPVLNYRLPLWLNFRYHMTGLLYWTTVYWGHVRDPWLDQPSFRLAYNGEGMLFYPGGDAGFDGPVTSIRLKNIREGMEDYEYFHLLVQRGEQEFVEREVRALARSWFDWEKDPTVLLATRARLAQRIMGRQR